MKLGDMYSRTLTYALPREETSATFAITGLPTATILAASLRQRKTYHSARNSPMSDCATAMELRRLCSPKLDVAKVRYAYVVDASRE